MSKTKEALDTLEFDRKVHLALCSSEQVVTVNKLYDDRVLEIVGHWHCKCENHIEWDMCCYCDCANKFGREW